MCHMTDSIALRIALFMLAVILFDGCSDKNASKDAGPLGPGAAVQTTSYKGVGVVKGMDPNLPTIELDHEDIKGLMPAMQMQFHVKDKALLNGLTVGDRIEFTVENGVGGLRVIALRKI